jgi:hypothetical protein
MLVNLEFKEIIEDLSLSQSIVCYNRLTEFSPNELKYISRITKDHKMETLNSDGICLVLSYLYNLGYLTNSEEKNQYKLPNYEIRKMFIEIMTSYYENIYSFDPRIGMILIGTLNSIVSQTSKDKIKEELIKFQTSFEEFLESIDLNILHNEDLFHSLLVYLSLLANYRGLSLEIFTKKNQEKKEKKDGKANYVKVDDGKSIQKGDYGNADILIAKNYSGIIIELNSNQSIDEGLNQALSYSPFLEGTRIKLFVSLKITEDRNFELKYEFGK